ncbi:MAG: threonine/serine exporter family protein [Clostridia bacterium]|nr:threonine/serine exporter family protein [Clostridia bacterium]
MKPQEKLNIFTATPHSDSWVDNLARVALDIGEGLLKSGAEIHRVEDAIEHICKAYGAAHVEVFSIQSLIVTAVRMPDGSYTSQSRRITDISNHLRCLEYYNRLSRDICKNTPDFDEIDKKIFEIKQKRKYPFWRTVIGFIFAASGFAMFFGGSLRDGLAAALVGFIMALLDRINVKFMTPVTKTLLISFTAGICSCLSVMIGIGQHVDMIAIGTIMILIPGLALGNSMRDLLSGDTLAGILKAVQSCIIAVIIAIGYSISILLLKNHYTEVAPANFSQWAEWGLGLLSAIIGTVGFALIFKISLKKLPIVGIGGAFTYIFYELVILASPENHLLAAFVSSLFMAIFSEICARAFRAPTVVFLFPCAIPIVPGSALYYSMYHLLNGNSATSLTYLSTTGQVILGIALGLSVATMLWGTVNYTIKQIPKRKHKEN